MSRIWATTQQAAAYFGIPCGTIRRWAHEGKLRRYGPKHRALYDLNDIAELVGLRNYQVNATVSSVGDLSPQAQAPSEQIAGASVLPDDGTDNGAR